MLVITKKGFIMTQMQNKVRFVHAPTLDPVKESKKFGAYTVAYHRCEDGVVSFKTEPGQVWPETAVLYKN